MDHLTARGGAAALADMQALLANALGGGLIGALCAACWILCCRLDRRDAELAPSDRVEAERLSEELSTW